MLCPAIYRHLYQTLPNPNSKPPKSLTLLFASSYIPKPNPANPLGEDSHFLSADAQTLGVADGVGRWAKHGVDAGEYARQLMHNAHAAVSQTAASGIDPKGVIAHAFRATDLPGSCTACIVSHRSGVLKSANVGDSGFLLFRGRKLVFKSVTRQKGFNVPFQLGRSEGGDSPECADVAEVDVAEGDVLVVGTDGLFDNVFVGELLKIVVENGERGVEDLSRLVAKRASENSVKRDWVSPYTRAALKAGKFRFGGKVDDITVVVGKFVMR